MTPRPAGLSAPAKGWLAQVSRWPRLALLFVMAVGLGIGLFVAEPASAAERPSAALAASVQESPEVPAGFSTLESGFLRIRYPKELGATARELAKKGMPFRQELLGMLGQPQGPFLEQVEVRLGRTHLEMEKLAPHGASLPKYAAGVAFSAQHLVLLTARPRYPGERHDLVEIFKHELAHVAIYDRLGGDRIPRWFNEGFAVFASGEAELSRMQTMWTATLAKKLIPLRRLEKGFPEEASTVSIAYAQASDIVRFLQRGDGLHRFRSIFSRMDQGRSFELAVADAYGSDLLALETEWLEDAARRYTFWPILLSSSTIWVVAIGLFFVAYVRRRSRSQEKLKVWAVEEAREDAERERIAAELARIRVVLAHPDVVRTVTEVSGNPSAREAGQFRGVPYVEHDGARYTLH